MKKYMNARSNAGEGSQQSQLEAGDGLQIKADDGMKECKNSRSNAREESQQSQLEAGDESQIEVDVGDGSQIEVDDGSQPSLTDSDDVKNNAGEERQQSLFEAGDGSQPPLANRKRKFLSAERFTQLADLKTKRKIAPIKKWIEQNEGESYHINAVHEIEITIDEKKQISHYAELFNEEMKLINVWITDIIKEELKNKNYVLESKDVYIMPLGKRMSMKTSHYYNNFVLLQDK